MAPRGRKGKSGTKKVNPRQDMDTETQIGVKNRTVQHTITILPTYSVNDGKRHLEFMKDASDLLFDFRFETFIQNNWPFSEPEGDLCNPKELALAGLSYIENGDQLSARCVVCAQILSGLEKDSDPWKLHAKKNPKCIIIQIGKPSKPDGYTLKQFMDIFTENKIATLDRAFKEMRDNVTKSMLACNALEAAKNTKDTDSST